MTCKAILDQPHKVDVADEEEKKAFDGTTLAQFLFGPGWMQAGTILLTLGIPRNDSDGTKNGMNPGNETQTPIEDATKWMTR